MNVLIFGATGGTGRELVKQGLNKGYTITAFVRNPAGINIQHKKLKVFKGDILDTESVMNAVKGHDVVISALGNKLSKNVLRHGNFTISKGIRHIVDAMEKQKIKRFIFTASFGVNKEIFLPQKIAMRVFLRNIFADIPAQEDMIKASGLDWTIVHPARLTNGVRTGKYHADEHFYITPLSHISRADVADFLLKEVGDEKYVRKVVTISY